MAWILADAHVHLFAPEALPVAAAAARQHFAALMAQADLRGKAAQYLFLAEMAGQDCFARLRDSAAALSLQPTEESCALLVPAPSAPPGPGGQPPLFLVAGRQIVSAEGLEILALGLEEPWPDQQPAETTVAALLERPVLVVLPWGVGKWLGRRGKLAQQLMDRFGQQGLFLGDNGNRPVFWPVPRLIAAWPGRNLPGSDPLNLAGQMERVGTMGLYAQASVDLRYPFRSFRFLLASGLRLRCFGAPQGVRAFFQSQLALRQRG